MKDAGFMKLAIDEACKSNSDHKVGAVIVKKGKIICRGFREIVNGSGVHAEEKVIKFCHDLKDSTMYLTLEPCYYRNSDKEPCCDLIIKSGIKKVFIGLKDINQKVSGKSIKKLDSFGIKTILLNKGMEKELLELLGKDYINKHDEA